MGRALVQQLLPILDKMKWPPNPQPSLVGHKTFEVGIDKIDDFRDDPKPLGDALRTFQTAESRPYALAGAAYTLLAAAREDDGSYAREGLEASLTWLEKAQETAPDIPDINMIEAFIYIYSGRLEDARIVLDYLHQQDPHNYYIHRAEMAYWIARDDLQKAITWCENSMNVAKAVPQRLRLQRTLGELYLRNEEPQKAVEALQEAGHFDPHNPYVWNQLAEAYLALKDMKEAIKYNDRALAMKKFPAALETQAKIRSRLATTGSLRDRIFGN